jgi:hypothetical protein
MLKEEIALKYNAKKEERLDNKIQAFFSLDAMLLRV